jgi:hypothetical protein
MSASWTSTCRRAPFEARSPSRGRPCPANRAPSPTPTHPAQIRSASNVPLDTASRLAKMLITNGFIEESGATKRKPLMLVGILLFGAGLVVVPGVAIAAPNDNASICSTSVLSYSSYMRNSSSQIGGVIQLRYCSSTRTTHARAISNLGCDAANGNSCANGTVTRTNDGYTRSCGVVTQGVTTCTTRGAGDIANTITSARADGYLFGPSSLYSGITSSLTY